MNKEKHELILIIFLILSIIVNLGLLIYIDISNNPVKIIGTYCEGDQHDLDDIHLVFRSDNFYDIYKQFEFIESGEYRKVNKNIYSLVSKDGDTEHFLIFEDSNTVTLLNSADETYILTRINDIPSYINVEIP